MSTRWQSGAAERGVSVGGGQGFRTGLAASVLLAAGLTVGGCGAPAGGAAARPEAGGPVTAAVVADGHLVEAESAVRAGDRRRALVEFTRAIEVNPNLTTAHMGMADLHRSSGDYSAAEVGYRRAATLEPRNFQAQYYHGLMLHLLNRVTEAIGAYLRALAINPNDFQANIALATAYYQLDEGTQALRYGQRAVELEPRSGPARFNLGAIFAAMDRHADAVREFQQATELMELTPDLLLNLSESLGRIQRYDEMRNTLEQLVRMEPSPAAHERLGFAQFRLGQFDAALASFDRSLAIDPDYAPALNGLGVSLLNRWLQSDQRDNEARRRGTAALRRSLQLNPNQPRVLELLSRYGA